MLVSWSIVTWFGSDLGPSAGDVKVGPSPCGADYTTAPRARTNAGFLGMTMRSPSHVIPRSRRRGIWGGEDLCGARHRPASPDSSSPRIPSPGRVARRAPRNDMRRAPHCYSSSPRTPSPSRAARAGPTSGLLTEERASARLPVQTHISTRGSSEGWAERSRCVGTTPRTCSG